MASPPDRNLVINAALAEYTALRAEVTNRISGQDTTLNLYMTAAAAIFGLALSGHADSLILLVIPLFSTAARLLYHNHNLYIRLVLRTLTISSGRWSRTAWASLACWAGRSGQQSFTAGRGGADWRIPSGWHCSSRSPLPWRSSWPRPSLPPRGRG
jgi:hypothetical protein